MAISSFEELDCMRMEGESSDVQRKDAVVPPGAPRKAEREKGKQEEIRKLEGIRCVLFEEEKGKS